MKGTPAFNECVWGLFIPNHVDLRLFDGCIRASQPCALNRLIQWPPRGTPVISRHPIGTTMGARFGVGRLSLPSQTVHQCGLYVYCTLGRLRERLSPCSSAVHALSIAASSTVAMPVYMTTHQRSHPLGMGTTKIVEHPPKNG